MTAPDCILDDIGIPLIESSLSKRVGTSKCNWDKSTLIFEHMIGQLFSTALSPEDQTVSTLPLRHSKGLDRIVKPVFGISNTWYLILHGT